MSKDLLGIPIGPHSLTFLVAKSVSAIAYEHGRHTFACANPHSLVIACKDDNFRKALKGATFVVADGIGVIIAGKLLNIDVGDRITGADFFWALNSTLSSKKIGRVFYLGSTNAVLQKLQSRHKICFPGLELVGSYSPPFGDWDDELDTEIVAKINASGADLLWVGMTAPKQEKWVSKNFDRLNVRVAGSIGAVFDFFAQTHRRAPAWMQNYGLEWLFRLGTEPQRMWKRTFLSGPIFAYYVLNQLVSRD